MRIRPAEVADRDSLYDICVRTGDAGEDASSRYLHPELFGAIWVGPYLALAPDFAFVAEDGDGVVGYVLGAADTKTFDETCEQRWWPALRAHYPEPSAPDPATAADGWLIRWIHRPPTTPAVVLDDFPAHLHIDLLPRGWGQGIGRRLMATLFDALGECGVGGVHLGVGGQNTRAIGFYQHLGFVPVGPQPDDGGRILGRAIRDSAAPPD